tara:strand:- start:1346 stop:1813 length:468 start_codon:yes stop_codon:yes gene_type:complete
MPSIYSGSTEITQIYSGSTAIAEVYSGSTLVWSANHRLTQGIQNVTGMSFRGYSSFTGASFGSISPSTLNGVNIVAVRAYSLSVKNNTAYYFTVTLSGTLAQNFFASVSESSLGQKNTTTLFNFNAGPTITQWTWALLSMPANWDGSGVLELDFV